MRRNDFPYMGPWGVESGSLQSAKMEILDSMVPSQTGRHLTLMDSAGGLRGMLEQGAQS